MRCICAACGANGGAKAATVIGAALAGGSCIDDTTVELGGASGPAVAAGDADLIAEEPGPLAAGMGDQRLVRRQLQLELVTQERRQALLDLLGFGLGSGGSPPDRRTPSRPSGRSTLSAPR
jgi:hypothetical protein